MLLKNIRDKNSLQQQRVYLYFLKEAKREERKKACEQERLFRLRVRPSLQSNQCPYTLFISPRK
jgi:hypothetical protein